MKKTYKNKALNWIKQGVFEQIKNEDDILNIKLIFSKKDIL